MWYSILKIPNKIMFTVATKATNAVDRLATLDETLVIEALFGFMDSATTATSRATFYNTKAEQKAALEAVHSRLFGVDRSLYASALMLPGMNDYSKQLGVTKLLVKQRGEDELLTDVQEHRLIVKLINDLPVHRMLKVFMMLREQQINNARTRKTILKTILNHRSLELWSIRYRKKMVIVLEHAWGKRMTGILRAILSKETRTEQEGKILNSQIVKYLRSNEKATKVAECVGFILGNRTNLTLPLFRAFVGAKEDIFKGARLPYEVLEGIRSRYYKDVLTSEDILDLTKNTLTTSQKMTLQNKAQKSGVKVELDWRNYDAVRLYVYAYKMGMTHDIRQVLNEKARQTAQKVPIGFQHVGILVDGSASMYGDETQAMRPIATACATRDMLMAGSQFSTIRYAGGVVSEDGLVQIEGDTTLANGVIDLLEKGVDAIFILTDGYENAPAGRVGEVIRLARQIGIDTPIFQASPVMAAEAGGLRQLSESVLTLAVSQPAAMGIGLIKAQLEMDLKAGLKAFIQMTLSN